MHADAQDWTLTPYSRRQWANIRKGGLGKFLFTSGITWWFAFLMSIGPVVSLMIAQESRRDISHVIWLVVGIIVGFILAWLNWRHCEAMWMRGAGLPEVGGAELPRQPTSPS
jgi:hypothetical protein